MYSLIVSAFACTHPGQHLYVTVEKKKKVDTGESDAEAPRANEEQENKTKKMILRFKKKRQVFITISSN